MPNGEPLTEISNCCRFCDLIVNSESGRQACVASWRKLAKQFEHQPHFVSCHAGLQYARARIEVKGRFEAMLIAGQFYAEQPDADEEQARIQNLVDKHNIDPEMLEESAQDLPVLDSHKQARIGAWLEDVAHTFEEIGRERADMIDRLRHIAEMSKLDFS
jgi:ligand-binding sensor protein